MLCLLRSWTIWNVVTDIDNQYHYTGCPWVINSVAIMNRIICCGFHSASKFSALSFRSIIVPINRADAMLYRLMSTNPSNSETEEKKVHPTPMWWLWEELIPRSEAVKDFSIPIEKLETPQERYQRIVLLYRKPNQISKNMLNRYFKLWGLQQLIDN